MLVATVANPLQRGGMNQPMPYVKYVDVAADDAAAEVLAEGEADVVAGYGDLVSFGGNTYRVSDHEAEIYQQEPEGLSRVARIGTLYRVYLQAVTEEASEEQGADNK